jgi:hypothetical protein
MVISVSDCEKGSSILPQKTNLNDENRTGESKSGIRERSTISNGKSLPTSMRECSTLLRHTKAEIKEIVLLRFQRREQERQQMIESLMFQGQDGTRSTLRSLGICKKSEAIKQLFQKLKSLWLIWQKSGVTCIKIPSPPTADPEMCTTWVQIDTPKEVARHLSERYWQHFGQAADSPFTTPPLSSQLGNDAQTDTAEETL